MASREIFSFWLQLRCKFVLDTWWSFAMSTSLVHANQSDPFATGVRVTMECFWNWTPCLETSWRENIPATHVEYRAACLWSIKAKRVSWFSFTSQWSNQEEGNWKSSKVIPFLINFATNSRDLSCLQLGYGYILYGLSHFISGWCWQLLLRLLSWSISAREPQEVLWVSQIFEIFLQ